MVDPPGPFGPRTDLVAFIKEMSEGPYQQNPHAQELVQQAKRDLEHLDSRAARGGSSKTSDPA
jgi:hypothetical protein